MARLVEPRRNGSGPHVEFPSHQVVVVVTGGRRGRADQVLRRNGPAGGWRSLRGEEGTVYAAVPVDSLPECQGVLVPDGVALVVDDVTVLWRVTPALTSGEDVEELG